MNHHHHYRAEDAADEGDALALDQEQPDQDRNRDRQDEMIEPGGRHLEAFHGAQHRDCRGDRAVSVKQGRADEADDEERGLPRARLCMAGAEQRQHGDDAALPPVVGPQDQHRVFQRDDEDQRPEDERYRADDRDGGRWAASARRPHSLLERVEGARSDIAIDDAERSEEEGQAGTGRDARVRRRSMSRFLVGQWSTPCTDKPKTLASAGSNLSVSNLRVTDGPSMVYGPGSHK